MIDLQPVKGTRDFFPDDMKLRNWLFSIWRDTALQFGFEEYDSCVLEKEELYIRKAGDEITEQLYCFEDKGGRRVSLRPEMTPSLARMILQYEKSLSFPIKWFSIPQCFRYERMTKGRRREHFQWNADIIGQPAEIAEAEILCMLLTACQKMGLTHEHVRLFLNDRRILNSILQQLEIPDDAHPELLVILDKRDKHSPDAFKAMLLEAGLSEDKVGKLYDFLSLDSLSALEEQLSNQEGIQQLKKVFSLVEEAGFGDFLAFDISIVRGLSYYTGTVFEMNHPLKNQRAICGGGRYDSLLSTYGGNVIPAVGFGFGDVVILDVLEEHGKLPKTTHIPDYWVVPFSPEQSSAALQLSTRLRQQGHDVHCPFSFRKLKKTLQQASEAGVSQVLLLLPDELERGEIVVRDMATREEQRVPMESWLASQQRS